MEIHTQGVKFVLIMISLFLFTIVDSNTTIIPDGMLVLTLTTIALIANKEESRFSFYVWSGLSGAMTLCFILKAFIL